jgi:hypothetical protein
MRRSAKVSLPLGKCKPPLDGVPLLVKIGELIERAGKDASAVIVSKG